MMDNIQKLHNDLTEYVANTMMFFLEDNDTDHEKSFNELQEVMTSGVKRYQCDPLYNMRVKSFVAQLINIIEAHNQTD